MWNISLCGSNVHIIGFVGIGGNPQYQERQRRVCCLIIKKSAIEEGKGKETPKEPANKKKVFEETTKNKMALAKIAKHTKANEW